MNLKKDLFEHFIVFTLLIIFILVSKNHDDFSYYHFPYSHLLTQLEHPIGIGQLNNGFRNPSSLFFLSSLFYLPKINFYLIHISPVYFLGFANIILYKLILEKNIFLSHKSINLLSLLSLTFINIFFYRLAEHGTDRSGQILVIIISIIILIVINNRNNILKVTNINLFYLSSILLVLLASLKPFYLIYSPIILILVFSKDLKKFFLELLFSRTTFYCLFYIFLILFFNFINSGCFIYPAEFTCFHNLAWSFKPEVIKDVNQWYELWSKAGATPNYVVENRAAYISHFNWLPNWIDNYFFNKVSDYLAGVMALLLVFWFVFYKANKKNKNYEKLNYKLIYLYLMICFIEWFTKHPALRYGGYHLIMLLIFIPFAVIFNSIEIDFEKFLKKSTIILVITLIIFFGRNINRIIKEYNQYNYNPFVSLKFKYDEKFYLRYYEHINKKKDKFKILKIFNKSFLITKE